MGCFYKGVLFISVFLGSTLYAKEKNGTFTQCANEKIKQNWQDTIPITSKSELFKLEQSKVWGLLSPEAQADFIKSLKFNQYGLVSLRFGDLEAELSVSEIYSLLSLFGAQRLASLMSGARIDNKVDTLILQQPELLKDPATFPSKVLTKSNENLNYHCREK